MRALDPELLRWLASIPAMPDGPPSPAVYRDALDSLPAQLRGYDGLPDIEDVEQSVVPGPAGPIAIRIYRPKGEPAGTLHFVHGGGWSAGSLAFIDPLARRLCGQLGMVVATNSYRLSPEHPYPAGLQDCLTVARWVLRNTARLGGAANPVVIGGESAGGNLSAAACIALRSGGATCSDSFDAQLLLYPALDLRDEAQMLASRQADADPGLPAAALGPLISSYCGACDPSDVCISPLAVDSVVGLPPALIVVLSVDPLRDEGKLYAERFKQEGVHFDLIEFENLIHGFPNFAGVVPAAAAAIREVVQRLDLMLQTSAIPHRRPA